MFNFFFKFRFRVDNGIVMWLVACILIGVYIPLVHAFVPSSTSHHYFLLLLLAVHLHHLLESNPRTHQKSFKFLRLIQFFPALFLPSKSDLYISTALLFGIARSKKQHAGRSSRQVQEGRDGQIRIGEEPSCRRRSRRCRAGCQGARGGGVGGPAMWHARAEEESVRRRRAGVRQARTDHPRQGEARRDHPRDLHKLGGHVWGAEEDGGGEDGAAPGRPEGGVQGQGEGLQGVLGHGRRKGPVQARRPRGPRGPGEAPPRGAPQRAHGKGRQGHRRRHRRGRQALSQGVGAGRGGAEGGEGGGERRGAGDGAAHERAAEAGRRRGRRRRQEPEADAGEARAEVRGGAGRRGRQECLHHPQIQRKNQATAAAKAATISASVPAAAAAHAAGDELGDVRLAVVDAIDILGLVDDHRHLHGVVRRRGCTVRLGTLLRIANANGLA